MADSMATSPGWDPRWASRGLHQLFFAYVFLADVLDLHSVLSRQPLRILPQLFAERLGKARVVQDPHLVRLQVRGHPLGETDIRQGSKHQDAVVAGRAPRRSD